MLTANAIVLVVSADVVAAANVAVDVMDAVRVCSVNPHTGRTTRSG